MTKLPRARSARYRRLFDEMGDYAEVDHPALRSLWQRAKHEGVDLFGHDMSNVGMFKLPYRRDLSDIDLLCVGIPMDCGAFDRPGAREGPEAVRRWSWRYSINDATEMVPFEIISAADWGDIRFEQRRYNLDDNLTEIAALFSHFREAKVIPFAVGGEHTATYAVLKGLTRNGEEPVGLIQFDAHGDMEGPLDGHRVHDGSLVSAAVADGFVDPERTIQIGLRSRAVALSDPFAHATGARAVRAREVKMRGIPEIITEARTVMSDGPVYLSFDTDVIDVAEMPGTTVPEPFGLTGWEAREFLLGLRGLPFVGGDLVEHAPIYDPTQKSSCLAAGLAFEIVCLLAEARHAASDVARHTTWSADSQTRLDR